MKNLKELFITLYLWAFSAVKPWEFVPSGFKLVGVGEEVFMVPILDRGAYIGLNNSKRFN